MQAKKCVDYQASTTLSKLCDEFYPYKILSLNKNKVNLFQDCASFKYFDKLNIFEVLYTVPAPLTDQATIQELPFWGPDYHIKNAKKCVLA